MSGGDFFAPSAKWELSAYTTRVNQFPMIENEEEERHLARRLREFGDKAAQDKLVTSHLRLVVRMALKYRRFGFPIQDLVSEGNIGLMQAVKRFDPTQACRLATYAGWWIRASIQDFIIRSWSLVRLGTTVTQRKLFFNLERLKRKIGVGDGRDMTDADTIRIGDILHVAPGEVGTMSQRLFGDYSLNTVAADSGWEWINGLEDNRKDPEAEVADREESNLRLIELQGALKTLNERERAILTDRCLRDVPRKLNDLSRQYGISSERVRQIEQGAIRKLRARIGEGSVAPRPILMCA